MVVNRDRSPHARSSGVDQLDLDAELLDRRRHLVADAHDVADRQVRRGLDVDDLHADVGIVIDVLPPDVRILDRLIPARRTSAPAAVDTTRATRDTRPARVFDAGLHRKRTVCDSSSRENSTFCSAGAADHPGGSSSAPRLLRGLVASLITVTRISRGSRGDGAADA